ncbi:MAG: hypothetical protein AABP62_26990 [Planctomycetota bacterium]
MPLKLLLDENLRPDGLWLAIQTRNATEPHPLDIVRVGDAETLPCSVDDLEIIRWAAVHGRLLVSLDKSTLPRHLHDHIWPQARPVPESYCCRAACRFQTPWSFCF